jgi:hypothetical protein
MGSELAPGDTAPDDGSNCAPPTELDAAQLKSPVELESFVSTTVQVVDCPVAEWQFEVSFRLSVLTPLPEELQAARTPMIIIARRVVYMRRIAPPFPIFPDTKHESSTEVSI